MTVVATYISSKSGLRVRRSQKRDDFFQFRDGRLELHSQEEVDLLDRLISEMAPSSRSMIRKVDPNAAAVIAKRHQQALLQMKGKVIQGAQTGNARAEQIHEVTTMVQKTAAAHQGINLVDELGLHGSPIVDEKLGDTPNPGVGVIADAVGNTAQKPTAQVETVKQSAQLKSLQLNIKKT